MNSFTQYILEEFSSIQNHYTPDYQTYKQQLINELDEVAPPTFRQDYWKNIKLDFLNQKWKYFRNHVSQNERLTQAHLSDLVGENNYTNIVFINGFIHSLDHHNSNLESLKVEKIGEDYDKLYKKKMEIFSFFQRKNLLKNWFLCFNEILNDEVVVIKLAPKKKLKKNVRIIFITDNDTDVPLTCPQVFFYIDKGADLNLIEEHFSLGQSLNNISLKFILQEDATLRHFLFQNESEASFHINHTYVEQMRGSSYSSYVLQQGSQNSIVQKTINLIEPQSRCELYGLSHPTHHQSFSNLTTVSHLAPQTHSQQLYRGILEDEAFHNFSGIVRVAHESPQSESDQLCQNLILDQEATAVSRPRLEIFNDDVKCTHGATCRDLDPQEIFYLISRGLKPKDCKELLIKAFSQDFYYRIQEFFPEWKP